MLPRGRAALCSRLSPLAKPCLPLLCVQPLMLCHPSPCCPFTAQLQELLEPGAHAQDAHAGGEGRAEPRPPAAGVPAQGEAAAPSTPGEQRLPRAAPGGRGPGASAPSLLTPFFPRRCASAPTWTHRAGCCPAGRLASCGRTAWRGWRLAQTSSCCRSAVPASARCTGLSPAAPAPPQPPPCQPSSGGPLAATACVRPQQQLRRLRCWVPGAVRPSWCFLPGACPGEGWLLLAVTRDAQDARPRALGPEGSFLRSLV